MNNNSITLDNEGPWTMYSVSKLKINTVFNKLVKIEPMPMPPAAKILYLDYTYGIRINGRYLHTKLKPSRIYKAIIAAGFTMAPLLDRQLKTIGRINPYDLCMYIKTEDLVTAENQPFKAYKIMVGDQAGYVETSRRIRFKRITSRMIRREQLKADKLDQEQKERDSQQKVM